MKLSIITISYNTEEILKQCLTSLYAHPCEHEIEMIIVDNDSHDGSVEMIRRDFPQVHCVANDVNVGFAAACNQAFRLSTGDYVFLLNSDAYIRPGAIESAVSFMEKNTYCGICGGRLFNIDGTIAPSARRFPDSVDKFITITGLSSKYPDSSFFGRPDYTYFDHMSVKEVDWVPGAFTIYRRQMLEDIGMFDERFYMYFEEVDLCLKAKRAGWTTYFNPEAEVEHIGGASSMTKEDQCFEEVSAQLLEFRTRSEHLYFRKNFGLRRMLTNYCVEAGWYALVYLWNCRSGRDDCRRKKANAHNIIKNTTKALKDTRWGTQSPEVPW